MSDCTSITRVVGSRQTLALTYCLMLLLFCPSTPRSAQAQSAPTTPPQAIELNKRGEALLAKKAYKAAAKEFRKALAIQPDYEGALHNLGKALEAEGKNE